MRLWDKEGNQIGQLRGHEDRVRSVAISPDGKTIASGGWDKTVRLWNLEGKQIGQLLGHQRDVISVAFSPDSKTIVSGGEDGTVRLWNLEGNQIGQLLGHDGWIASVAISPDGKAIVSGGEDGTVLLWDIEGNQIGQLLGHEGNVNSVAFSPDGKTIISGSSDGTIRLWNEEGNQIGQLQGHEGDVWSVAISPDGQTIISGGGDKTVRLWREGDLPAAVAKFEEAQKLDSSLDVELLRSQARQWVAPAKLQRASLLAKSGEAEEALAVYLEARKLDPTGAVLARQELIVSLKRLCWHGSLRGLAANVIDACETAAALQPKDGSILDSRGLARALTGDAAGAIEDFEAFIELVDGREEAKLQRQGWIDALRKGEYPFTAEELERLLN